MVIAVAAGKGGTGKTMVAVNLALALHRSGLRTILVDADVEEPNAHLFLRPCITKKMDVTHPVPRIDEALCNRCGQCASFCAYGALAVTPSRALIFDDICHGCGGCALVCSRGAISEEEKVVGQIEAGRARGGMGFFRGMLEIGEPQASPIVEKLKDFLDPEAVNIIDCGPGTGCAVMAAVRGADLCLMVTEPTPFGLHDLKMAIGMARALGVESMVIINKDVPNERQVREFCSENGLDILLSIPFSREIALLTSQGINLVDWSEEWEESFRSAFRKINELVAAMEVEDCNS